MHVHAYNQKVLQNFKCMHEYSYMIVMYMCRIVFPFNYNGAYTVQFENRKYESYNIQT